MRYSSTMPVRASVLAAAGFLVSASAGFAVAAGAADSTAAVPPAVEKIVQRFAADSAGVVVLHQSVVYDQKAPGHNEHDEQDVSFVQQDRKGVGIRFHRVVEKGHTDTAEELAKAQDEAEKRLASEPPHIATRFSLPYYPESAGDYAFTAPKACAECPGGQSVDFKSAMNDERHGHGTMSFDPATSRVTKLDFVPNVFPKSATAAKVTYTFGRHDDGGWGTARVEEHYSGRMLMISGTADRITTIAHAKHVASVDEGRKAIQTRP
ncbi:MAG: hypothetical protein QOJ39_1750 [Candidatus Eremiobacteraeota bacterium]|jgi:hypothetical protein|nr:hypothetical protein [Candidatus Eremiobacteraeota bacterium]